MASVVRTYLFVVAAALIMTLGLATGAAAEEPFCFECHDEFPEVSAPHDPADSGECTACHEDHGDDEELRLVEEGAALCYQCHDEMTGKGSIHPPVEDGECTSCHNPHGSNNEGLLVVGAEELCFECHDEVPEVASPHDPVASGECAACHQPHASDNGALLVTSVETLCYECHDEMTAGASIHPPVEDGECTSCHSPHGSENTPLLVTAAEELCFECHDSGFDDVVVHAAMDDGCGECHEPHTSEHPKLFTANLTLERLARFEEAQGELCFNCHDAEALTTKGSEDTEFRNGQENLHALHLTGGAKPNKYGFIKKKDGQTCVACHLPHSSLQHSLVRTEFECKGIFCYTMRFRPNESGGTCIVGCHKPRTYSRNATKESSTARAGVSVSSGMQTPSP